MLSRVIYGARISMMIVGIVLSIGGVLGTLLGLVAGYCGGQVDELLMRFVDFTLAVPFVLVAFVVVMVLGQSFTIVIVLLILFSWSPFARQVRGEALGLKATDYVALARVAGAGIPRVILRHMLPGVSNTAIVVATLRIGTLIMTEATLSFLGLGIPPPTPAWGLMVAEGRTYVGTAWWLSTFSGGAIVVTVLAFNFLGDWLRDRLDPRLRQL
ncbi:MAG: ABC transporter permease [Chloroflexota bacterium]